MIPVRFSALAKFESAPLIAVFLLPAITSDNGRNWGEGKAGRKEEEGYAGLNDPQLPTLFRLSQQ